MNQKDINQKNMKTRSIPFLFLFALLMAACSNSPMEASAQNHMKLSQSELAKYQTAYFASGCFWCVEAVFESVKGVKEAHSGYSGGAAKDANYQAIGTGMTGHAESVEVYYDPTVVSYETLLKVFFGSHDPTTLNQQGPDRGTQYRSAIFFRNKEEKAAAEAYIAELKKEKVFNGKITTELAMLDKFYMAEDYHQDYERLHPDQPYVRSVSIPRLKRFQAKYPELLKGMGH